MAKTRNLTPSMQIPSAENELVMPFTNELPLGQRNGGVNMYSNSFKRGYGNDVFGSDENGIWLGAADFPNAPFRVKMNGDMTASSFSLEGVLTEDGEAQELSGSIVAGGVVDGRIIVKNASGDVIVLLDQDGILVNDGKITVQTEDSISILDSKGLVSTAAFASASVIGSGSQNTTSTTFVDVTGVTLSFDLDRTQNVYLFAHVFGASNNFGSTIQSEFRLLIDAVQAGALMNCSGIEKDTNSDGIMDSILFTNNSTSEVKQLTAGSHTLKLQFRIAGAITAFAARDRCILGYLILGN